MKIISTTIHCSKKEYDLIKFTAKKKGFRVKPFVNYCLDKNLQIEKVKDFDLNINRTKHRINLSLPEFLKEKLDNNQKSLSTSIRKIPMYQIVLTAVLMECEG